jgi:hypothetical protein
MNYRDISPMTPERWISNLLEAATDIADKKRQELRWTAPDRYAWERPEEVINVLLDDSVFEGFLEKYASSFSDQQRQAAFQLRDAMNKYCDDTPTWLEPSEVLADARWEAIRQDAAEFIVAFKGKWPTR